MYKPNLKKIPIEKLTPADYHPRKDLKTGDPMYEKLHRSVEEFGYVELVVWNERTGTVVGGHQRLKVLRELGYTEVDCVVVDLDEYREKALNVALNKIQGEWDLQKLADIMQEFDDAGFNSEITGFEPDDLEKLFKDLQKAKGEVAEDDFNVEAEAANIIIPIIKQGDICLVGRHRVMCGDSTDIEQLRKLMGGKKAHMVFTDPPWNVNYGGTDHPSWKRRDILNDNMSTEDFAEFMLSAFKGMAAVSELGAMCYCVMSAAEWGNLMLCMKAAGYHWSSTIIWAKNSPVLSRKDYHTQYEPIWYGWLAPKKEKALCHLKSRNQSDLWHIDRPSVSKEHPTMKPIALVAKAVENSSEDGNVVLDVFGGSGSALIACEQTGRVNFSMELAPKYVELICKRYIKFKESDEDVFVIRDGVKMAWHEIPEPEPPESPEESAEEQTQDVLQH